MFTLGVIGTSKKENEKRKPIHPDHLSRLPRDIRTRLIFEEGYGEPFGIRDSELAGQTGGIASRRELLSQLGTVILPKPMPEDFQQIREGGIIWGWPHCVQQRAITQAAIDRKLTLIAFEEMFEWGSGGEAIQHTFYRNNEFAGYCAALHALQLKGIDGHFGGDRKVVIFSFGAVSRGAIYALKAHGFSDITICTQRPHHLVRQEIAACRYLHFRQNGNADGSLLVYNRDGSSQPLIDLVSQADIIVNGIFQDPNNPVMFVDEEETARLKRGCLVIDISCDEGMGFHFAKPTSFEDPMFKVDDIDYYAVDHTPSYLWQSASRTISEALVEYIPVVMAGRQDWHRNQTIHKAIDIENGVIQKEKILRFQKRETQYPHHLQD